MDSGNKNLVESTQDLFLASGLSPHDSSTAHPVFYPGSNQLGHILESIRTELHRESVLIKQLSTVNHDVPITPVSADKQHAPASQRVPKDLNAANGDQPSSSTPQCRKMQTHLVVLHTPPTTGCIMNHQNTLHLMKLSSKLVMMLTIRKSPRLPLINL